MTPHLGPIDICCDAPPYSIIQACDRIGIQRAEDVRWCRMSHFLDSDDAGGSGHGWKTFLAVSGQRKTTCSCGQTLPNLEKCTFTFITGREVSYFLGQCKRCWTVFWDEV
jgi:hypothetical protein